ncbi:hypothetical protein [Flavobacterium psychrophilum]|uniref:hypothetical protein n=1 Tax=Flavobacterium psychrophilum TaxID=96345 RepID=UPI000B7C2A9B|nr:hypothetical protein [Flavobacterium psychrophilum]SNA88295.1 hypothetical protein FI146_840158 [Flavobacterium psychrophilum]
MENKRLIPDYKNYCDKFTDAPEFTIKIPYIKSYYSVGCFLENLIKGVQILAQHSIENSDFEAVSIISDLADIAINLNVTSELTFVDRIIDFSNQEELKEDDKIKILKDELKMVKGANNYLQNELRTLKSEQNV